MWFTFLSKAQNVICLAPRLGSSISLPPRPPYQNANDTATIERCTGPRGGTPLAVHCRATQKDMKISEKKNQGNASKKIRKSAKKKLRISPKKIWDLRKKKSQIQIFFFCKPSQWFSIFGFCGRMPAGRKSRRMYCRRPPPGLIGTLEFEEKK